MSRLDLHGDFRATCQLEQVGQAHMLWLECTRPNSANLSSDLTFWIISDTVSSSKSLNARHSPNMARTLLPLNVKRFVNVKLAETGATSNASLVVKAAEAMHMSRLFLGLALLFAHYRVADAALITNEAEFDLLAETGIVFSEDFEDGSFWGLYWDENANGQGADLRPAVTVAGTVNNTVQNNMLWATNCGGSGCIGFRQATRGFMITDLPNETFLFGIRIFKDSPEDLFLVQSMGGFGLQEFVVSFETSLFIGISDVLGLDSIEITNLGGCSSCDDVNFAGYKFDDVTSVTYVIEPSTLVLLGIGLVGIGFARYRKGSLELISK